MVTYAESLQRARELAAARQRITASVIAVCARSKATELLGPSEWEQLADEIVAELERPGREDALRILGGGHSQ